MSEKAKAFVRAYMERKEADAEKAKERADKKRKALKEMAAYSLKTGRKLTVAEFEAYTGISFSHNMSGKMENVLSLSTACIANPRCRERYLSGNGICAECFSFDGMDYKNSLRENTVYNLDVLSTVLIPLSVIPKIDREIVRIESFGDTASWIQAANYIDFCLMNPQVDFGVWTKNPDHYDKAFHELNVRKLDNMHFVLSSQKYNEEVKVPEKYRYFVDKVFTVFQLDYMRSNNIPMDFINCGGRSCDKCRRCYRSNLDNKVNHGGVFDENGIEYIRELLKSDQKKLKKGMR